MNVLLSTTYFGPVQWYQKLYRADEVWIERYESFQKQTYRNRCVIATTQGTQALTVPVEAPSCLPQLGEVSSADKAQPTSPSWGRLVGATRISDHGNWRHLHWNALQSAYGDSPFFMYYEDDLRPFFEQRWDYLFDFNEAIREKICKLLDIHPIVHYTESFISHPPLSSLLSFPSSARLPVAFPLSSFEDFREAINPKHPAPDPDFTPRRYYQVYEAKHGFQPNLSILDLLFNMGPESIFWL
jgi:hypothetical protein